MSEPLKASLPHYAMIPMEEYERVQRYYEVAEALDEAVYYGRVTGKLEGYRLVLQHVQASTSLTPVKTVAPGVIQALERIIQTLQADLAKLGTPAPPPAEPFASVEEWMPVPKGGTD